MFGILALVVVLLVVIPAILYFASAQLIRNTKRPPRWIGFPVDADTNGDSPPIAAATPDRTGHGDTPP